MSEQASMLKGDLLHYVQINICYSKNALVSKKEQKQNICSKLSNGFIITFDTFNFSFIVLSLIYLWAKERKL